MLEVDIQVNPPFEALVDVALIERAVAGTLAFAGLATPAVSVLITDERRATPTQPHLPQRRRFHSARCAVVGDDFARRQPAFVRPPDAPRYGGAWRSYERVIVQAAEYGHSRERELAFLTVHGVHRSYDHERGADEAAAMRAAEQAVMLQIGLRRISPERPE
ncbi:MAG: rRNA maturation RNAse YbeY [Kouleothrix sp.]